MSHIQHQSLLRIEICINENEERTLKMYTLIKDVHKNVLPPFPIS